MHKKIVEFCKAFNKKKIEAARSEIQEILSNGKEFPKNISMIYDDRIRKHSFHIILSFLNAKISTLIIDNTLSPLYTFVD